MVAQVLRDLLAGGLDRLADAIRVHERPPAGDGHLRAAAAGNEHWLATVRARAPELLTGGGIHVGTPAPVRPVRPVSRRPRPEGGDAPVTAPEPQPATPGGPTFVGRTRARRRPPEFGVTGERRRAEDPGYDEAPRGRRTRRPVLRLRRVTAPGAPDRAGGPGWWQRPPLGATLWGPPKSPPPAAPRPVPPRPVPPEPEAGPPARRRISAPSFVDPEPAVPPRPPRRADLAEPRPASGEPASGQPVSWEAVGLWPALPGASRATPAPQFDDGSPREHPEPAFPVAAPGTGDRDDLVAVERTGPWPDLPDDTDGWLPPRSVFIEAWVRVLDDEQRCG